MIKKYIYFLFGFTMFFLFKHETIFAKEYCNLFLNNEKIDTIELPFYYYKLNRETDLNVNGMPKINYTKTTSYIDSLTKCELIKDTITYSVINIYSANIIDYSNELSSMTPEEHFEKAKITSDGGILIGLSTKVDEEPPAINGYEKKYTTNIDNPLNIELLIKNFTAYDNFDGNISHKIKIEYNEYSTNINNTGNYPIILSVEDSYSNKTTITFYIEIIDITPPTIEGETNYISYLSSPITIENIKENLTISDNTNKDYSMEIFACEDLFTQNKNTIGYHSIFFCAYDDSNNLSSPFKVTIEVKDDIPPTIEGLNHFNSYISSPLTIKEIMYSLAASDNGKDISSSIFVTNDLYSNYQNTMGEKKIYFQTMDESNNLSIPFEVTINLIDDIAPQIYGLNNFNSYLSSPLSITYLKQQLTVIDNIDGNISNSLEILNDTYSNNINNKGTYYITFIAKDASNNTSEEFKTTITTIDDVAPYFIGPQSLTYQLNQKPSLETILAQYTIKDNIDATIELEILEDTYSTSIETGISHINLTCKDASNNSCPPFIIKIELVEELIYLNEISLILPTTSLFSLEKINKLINLNQPYTIIENTYNENYSIEGSYTIKYELENKTLIELTIQTFNIEEKKQENILTNNSQKKETFISKIKRFFQKIINWFKNLLKTIIPIKVYPKYL